MEQENILVSFSGGKTSGYMAHLMQEWFGHKCNLLFVFANTGKELEQTLLFAHKVDKYLGLNLVWVEAQVNEAGVGTGHKVVDYDSASRNGEPFEAMIQKFGIPNKSYPHCTRELKQAPIHSYAKEYFKGEPYKTAIGIRADEFDRMALGNGRIYPLIKAGITKQVVNEHWDKMPFTLELEPHQGNCDACWKKSDKKLVNLALEDATTFTWWAQMEAKYGSFIPKGQKRPKDKKITFFREHKSALDIVGLAAKQGIKPTLFDDNSNGCEESCEAF